jgi:hypothetical protein
LAAAATAPPYQASLSEAVEWEEWVIDNVEAKVN